MINISVKKWAVDYGFDLDTKKLREIFSSAYKIQS